jgi:zinc transporter ZupT
MTMHRGFTQEDFVRQQGCTIGPPKLYRALMLQPRLVCVAVAIGMWRQDAKLFLMLSACLAWCAAVPEWNPIDRIYNAVQPDGAPVLPPSPAPRRTAMALASLCAGVSSVAIHMEAWRTAWTIEGLLLVAALAVVVGRFCFGSFVYYQVTRWLDHAGIRRRRLTSRSAESGW